MYTLLENFSDDPMAKIYGAKCSTISLYFTKFYVIYSKILQHFSNSYTVGTLGETVERELRKGEEGG